MNIFPIALRTLERPVFLDTTIRSIKASTMPDCPMVVIDDCSGQADTKKYLFSDEQFRLSSRFSWPHNCPEWDMYVGKIHSPQGLTGITKEIEVVSTGTRKGDVGGIFWIVDYMMTRYPDAPAIIVFEADCVVRKEWYTVVESFYSEYLSKEGPLSNMLGLLTCCDVGRSRVKVAESAYESPFGLWRGAVQGSNGRWGCSQSLSAQVLLITRQLYDKGRAEFKRGRSVKEKSGDHAISTQCASNKFNAVVTHPSYCQHIGFDSLLWPTKGIRVAVNFTNFCFEKLDSNGYAYSEKWIL